MDSIADRVKRFYERLSPFTRGALVLLLIVIPDWASRGGFWYSFLLRLWPTLKGSYESPYGKLALVILAFFVIWMDQKRLTRKLHRKGTDPNSLKYRASDLRTRIVKYLNTMPEPEHKATTPEKVQEELTAAVLWSEKLSCGFELRFKNELNRLFLEFGEIGLLPGFGWLLPEHIYGMSKINEIVSNLEQLVKIAEEKQI
jgi:hypothetical protein